MSYKVSEDCVQVLKSLYEGKKFTPLKSKEDVQELLMGLSFLLMMGSAAKNKDDEKAKEAYEKMKAAGEELKAHGKDLDLDDFNSRMM